MFELHDRRRERIDEPVRDERRGYASGEQQRECERQGEPRPPALSWSRARPCAGAVGRRSGAGARGRGACLALPTVCLTLDDRVRATACPLSLLALGRLVAGASVGAQIGNHPCDVDHEQADGPHRRDHLHVMTGGVVRGERQAEQDDDEDGHEQQRRGVARKAVREAHHAVGSAVGPDDYHEAEHEHRVGEDRPDDRRLGDHELTLLQREDDHEQLWQIAERRLQHTCDSGPKALAQLLCGKRHDPRQPGERERGDRKARNSGPGLVVGHSGKRREQSDQRQREALLRGQPGHGTRRG